MKVNLKMNGHSNLNLNFELQLDFELESALELEWNLWKLKLTERIDCKAADQQHGARE